MKAVIQRVSRAKVIVGGELISNIGEGFLILVGVKKGDDEEKAKKLAKKIANLRIFEGKEGKLNLSLKDVGGEILLVSQFTLYADVEKGRRPSFDKVARREEALILFNKLRDYLREEGIPVFTGKFGEKMSVELVNEGPVTIIMEV